MRVLAAVLILIAAACGSSRDDAERKARAAVTEADQRMKAAHAKEKVAELKRRAAEANAATQAKAKELLAEATRARALGERAKAELDKVYRTKSNYDLDITTAAATTTHAEKLAAMPHVTVGDLTVGYEEATGMSVTGTSSRRHFRATWRRGDRDVIVGYQTESNLDLAAFAKLLQKLVPVVEAVL